MGFVKKKKKPIVKWKKNILISIDGWKQVGFYKVILLFYFKEHTIIFLYNINNI